MEPSSTLSSRAAAQSCEAVSVLLIDDDDDFRDGLAENLRDDGHVVDEHADPPQLTALQGVSNIGVVILDYHLADYGSGIRFADRLHAAHPRIPIILITADWTDYLEAQVEARDFLHLVRKPFDYFQLHDLAHRLATGMSS